MTSIFDRFDLDPAADAEQLTEHFRGLVESTTDDDRRRALREAWETLARDPKTRLEHALRSFPERPALALPRRAATPNERAAMGPLVASDFLPAASLASALEPVSADELRELSPHDDP